MRRALLVSPLLVALACGSHASPHDSPDASAPDASTPDTAMTDAAPPAPPTTNLERDVLETDLAFDLTATTATATISLAESTKPDASFEIGDLTIDSVTIGGAPAAFVAASARLDVAVPTGATTVTIAYHWKYHPDQDGASDVGWTILWPYYCGNLFPCHSAPSDGEKFKLELTNVPAGKVAVYPKDIPADAPSYQLAWAINTFTEIDLGTTTAGTHVHAWAANADNVTKLTAGTKHLKDVFDWYEKTLGAYRFGKDVGSVEADWGAGAYGGMEHHPFWHVGADSLDDEVTSVHEAAHGWFGDGIRIACWEDFVLSEGTVSYLAARSLESVAGQTKGDAVWKEYALELKMVKDGQPVWMDGCNQHDILKDHLFTNAPYMRGAFFYRGVAQKVGADKLDHALGAFYQKYQGKAAHMSDMLDTIKADTGYDAAACAKTWLKDAAVPAPGPCP